MRSFFFLISLFFSVKAFSQSPAGFFLDDFQPKTNVRPAYVESAKPDAATTATVVINVADKITPVSKYLFGNNANPYMTQMVDQPALLKNIKALSPNVIRFPGGNLSSIFFWNEEKDQPPVDAPSELVDANGAEQNPGYWYGKNTESWTLSVDNYYSMLEETGSEGIITVNYGYARYSTAPDPVAAAAHLAADWVRYDNGRTKFWEIGNESNGTWQAGFRINTDDNKDGQPEVITGALYGNHFKVFADSMRKAATEKGHQIYIGAQLLQEEPAGWWNATDTNWNNGVFAEAADAPDYYIIHSYYTPYNTNSNVGEILSSAVTVTKDMMDYVTQAQAEAGVTAKPIALTEWNIFATGSKQQASFINGIHATLVLGELIKNKYGLACRWDLANAWDSGNDHGMFNQGDEPGATPKWNPRAAFYYMYYFQKLTGDHMVSAHVTGNTDVVSYTSTFDSKDVGVVVINKGTSEQTVEVSLQNFSKGERYYLYSLTGGEDNGDFSLQVFVNEHGPAFPTGGPANVETIPAKSSTISGGIKFSAPARSVQYLLIEYGDNITSTTDEKNFGVKIFPNPAHGKITLHLPPHEFEELKLFDLSGREVYQHEVKPDQTIFETNLDLSQGLYFIRLRGSKNVLFFKVVVD